MENIFTVAKPFLTFAKLLGVFPMSFEGPARKGFLKVHWSDLMFSGLGFISLILYFYFTMLVENLFSFLSDSMIVLKVWKVVLKLSSLVLFCQFWYQLTRRRLIARFLHLIRNFDMEVSVDQKLS
jgi:hypothetical protein